jgi:serine/threonine-protein kinase
MTQRKPNLTCAVGVAFTVLFTLLALSPPPFVQSLELFLYDTAMNLPDVGEETRKPDVTLVEIDEESGRSLGPWPWPRHLLAEMVALLDRDGAKVIGMHVPLPEKELHQGLKELRGFKERFSAYSFSKKDEGLREWVLENLKEMEEKLDADRLLAERTKLAGNVIFAALVRVGRTGIGSAEEDDPALLKAAIDRGGLSLPGEQPPGITVPFADLLQAGLGIGHAGLSLEEGMEGRSHPPFVVYRDRLLPSFPLRSAMAFLGLGLNQLGADASRVRMGDSTLPWRNGELLVDFRRSAAPLPRYSFGEVLRAGKLPAGVAGKIVLIGFNLEESRKVATPVSPMTVLEFHARVIQSLLSGRFIQRPSSMLAIEIGTIWLVGLFALFMFMQPVRWRRHLSMAGLLVLAVGMGFLLLSEGLWMKTGLTAIFIMALYPALFLSSVIPGRKTTAESFKVDRLLGIRLQEQGLLDPALEQFRKIPLDQTVKELIYRLGLEYERRGDIEKALGAYDIVRGGGGYGDIEDRVKGLRDQSAAQPTGGTERDAEGQESGPEGEIKRVGRYEVIQELGKGSMGLVYKARDPRINRLLAIKTIRFSDEFDPEVVQEVKARFFREAEIAGRLSHPSIVTVYDVGEDQDLTYMAMEYLEGEDLEMYVTKGNLLPLRRVLEVVASIADALDYAHKAGVIHRDIKPANIMLLKQGGVKVTDFGIAKAVSSSRTRTGVILGTPNYMSPEQIMGQRIDYRTDIFSLGVLFYQSVTGELPFRGQNLSSLLYQITQAKHSPAKDLAPRLPRACEQIIDKALAKNPNHRFSSAGEVARLARLIISKMDQMQKPLAA